MAAMNNNGFQTTVLTANTTGAQVFWVGTTNNSGTANIPVAQGLFGSLIIGADSTANTITAYDGSSTGGTLRFKIVTPTATPLIQLEPNIQFITGLFIVISGGTTVNINIGWL